MKSGTVRALYGDSYGGVDLSCDMHKPIDSSESLEYHIKVASRTQLDTLDHTC